MAVSVAARALLATGLLAAALATSDHVGSALGADDECQADDEHCALSAAQLRADKLSASAKDVAGAKATADLATNEAAAGWLNGAGIQYNAQCFDNTGSPDCRNDKAKGNGGTCTCINGCMGADGNCHTAQNKVLAKDFILHNKQYPKYLLYVKRLTVFGQMSTTSYSTSYNMGQDKFTLYELPGKLDGKSEYFLASSKWPDYVVSIQGTGGTAVSLYGAYAVSLKKFHAPWNLKDVMMRVCSARKLGHPDAIMVGTSVPSGGSTIWSYVHGGSYLVYGYWYPEQLIESKIVPGMAPKDNSTISSVPGMGGLWVPTPPFPQGLLPDCE